MRRPKQQKNSASSLVLRAATDASSDVGTLGHFSAQRRLLCWSIHLSSLHLLAASNPSALLWANCQYHGLYVQFLPPVVGRQLLSVLRCYSALGGIMLNFTLHSISPSQFTYAGTDPSSSYFARLSLHSLNSAPRFIRSADIFFALFSSGHHIPPFFKVRVFTDNLSQHPGSTSSPFHSALLEVW